MSDQKSLTSHNKPSKTKSSSRNTATAQPLQSSGSPDAQDEQSHAIGPIVASDTFVDELPNCDSCEGYRKVITTIRDAIMEFASVINDHSLLSDPGDMDQNGFSSDDYATASEAIHSNCERLLNYCKKAYSEYVEQKVEQQSLNDQLRSLNCPSSDDVLGLEELLVKIDDLNKCQVHVEQIDRHSQTDQPDTEESSCIKRVSDLEKCLRELEEKVSHLKVELSDAHLELQNTSANSYILKISNELVANNMSDIIIKKNLWKNKVDLQQSLYEHSSEKFEILKGQLSAAEDQISSLSVVDGEKEQMIDQEDVEIANLRDEIAKGNLLVNSMKGYPDLLGAVPLAEDQDSVELTIKRQVEINMARIKALQEASERYGSILEKFHIETLENVK